jgi:cytochrome c peroxidase
MHDGRFNTLLQCLNHYRHGVQQSATLDTTLVNGIQLTDAEAGNLISFLRTLTDSSFLKDARYSKP